MAKFKLGNTNKVFELKNTKKEQAIREMRAEASRLAALANKRIERLERNKLTDTPAYKMYMETGAGKFGVKGKDYNQVQQELSRLRTFVNAKTSTIRGANNTLKEIASNTGIKYKNLTELRAKSAKFFELSSKVEQYLRTVDDMASAIGYQKIWEAVNQYTKESGIDLADGEADIDSMIEQVAKALKEYEDPMKDRLNETGEPINWYLLKD